MVSISKPYRTAKLLSMRLIVPSVPDQPQQVACGSADKCPELQGTDVICSWRDPYFVRAATRRKLLRPGQPSKMTAFAPKMSVTPF